MPKNLQTLHYILLGFLNHQKYSGYDLKKVINHQIGFFYKNESFGTIYRSLDNLAELKLIKYSEEPSNKRDGTLLRIFSITLEGARVLEEWLKIPLSKQIELDEFNVMIPRPEGDEMKIEKFEFLSGNTFEFLSIFLIKVFFLGEIYEKDKITIFNLINDFKLNILQKVQPTLDFSENNLRSTLNEPAHKFFLITLLFGKRILETFSLWEEEVKKILNVD
ncbi:MAG: PadR family transcriptional regulator [Candidatus Hodarchaeales archaeon]|jgi:DNA-binding PadR family transcriptional regulator